MTNIDVKRQRTIVLVTFSLLIVIMLPYAKCIVTPYGESNGPERPNTKGALTHSEIVYYEEIFFSGMWWGVKNAKDMRVGPQYNLFSNSSNDIWVDEQDRLHLTITEHNGEWYCTEVIGSSIAQGYGAYIFCLEGSIDEIDKNVILGLFTYQCGSDYNHREKDIEFADLGENNIEYVVQPVVVKKWKLEQDGPSSKHMIVWQPERIIFLSFEQSCEDHYSLGDIKALCVYQGKYLHPPGSERVHMNLYLKANTVPESGERVEVIISNFEFMPFEIK